MSTDLAEYWPVIAMAPKTAAGGALNRTVPSDIASLCWTPPLDSMAVTAPLPRPLPRLLAPPLPSRAPFPPRPRPPLPPPPLSISGTMPGEPPFFGLAVAFPTPGEPPSFGFALPFTELGEPPAFGFALLLDFPRSFSLSTLPFAFLSWPLDFFAFLSCPSPFCPGPWASSPFSVCLP